MNIASAPFLSWPETKALLARANALGIELRFVGGCVRDALLGRTVTDIDLATPTLPQDVLVKLPDGTIKTYPTGIDHGTITARIGTQHFEITTLREDVACDGRHAEVKYSTDWKRDAMRRDFTINALYATADGEVIDAVGGLADLSAKTLRFIGTPTDRIIEDALRILRFFRFATELEFMMDAPSLSACTHQSTRIEDLSGERIQLEFFKLLSRMKNDAVLQLMHSKGVLQHVLPYSLNTSLNEALEHTHDPIILLALMLGGRDEDMARKDIKHRLKLSNVQFDLLEKVLANAAPTTLQDAKKLLRNIGEKAYRGVVLKGILASLRGALAPQQSTFLDLPQQWSIPEFPVKAADLLALGHTEGKALGQHLKTLEERWEMSDYSASKDELLKGIQ
jgi:poly(A) polymerase